jgi:hypothetical protein
MAVIQLGLTDQLPDVVAKQNSNNLYTINNVAYAQTAGAAVIGGALDGILKTGWIPLPCGVGGLTYSSWDGTVNTAVMNTLVDCSGAAQIGDKFYTNQGAENIFGIITAITSTQITALIQNGRSITNYEFWGANYSHQKTPLGFPLDPNVWSVTVTNSVQLTQSSPGAGVIYNVGGLDIIVPIGIWTLSGQAGVRLDASSGALELYTGLSTSSTSFDHVPSSVEL